jgi:hypothetical protein
MCKHAVHTEVRLIVWINEIQECWEKYTFYVCHKLKNPLYKCVRFLENMQKLVPVHLRTVTLLTQT